MRPLVSLIVISHNRASMVTRALDSVYEQTYRPIELIVVDDGSTDNSWEVISSWQKAHPDTDNYTSQIRRYTNGGIASARIHGLEESKGVFLQYVDDDDWLLPNCIEKKIALVEQEAGLDVVVHQMTLLNRQGRRIGKSNITLATGQGNQMLHLLKRETETLIVPVLMMRRNAMLAVGGWTVGQNFAEDMDITLRMAAKGSQFALVNEELSIYNMHGQARLCNTAVYNLPDSFWPDFFRRIYDFGISHGVDRHLLAEAIHNQLAYYGLRYLRWGRFSCAWQCFDTATSISGRKCAYNALPAGLRHISAFPDYLLHSLGRCLKRSLRFLFRR